MNDQDWPAISIIVPVRNAERTMDTMMHYLDALDYPRDRTEILVADGGSTDDTAGVVRRWQEKRPNIRFLEVPDCASPGHARNAALPGATSPFVLFTDGDCAPEPGWAKELLKPFFADPTIGGVGGEILTLRTDPDNETESYCEQTGFLSVSGRCGLRESGYLPVPRGMDPHEVNGGNFSPFFATANVAFRKSVIDQVGGKFWDEATGEDVDFSLRVLLAGYRLYFAKEAVVKHMHRVALPAYLRQWRGYGYGHPLLLAKHASSEFEIVLQFDKPVFVTLPSHLKGIVHVGTFQLMHLFGASTVATGIWSAADPNALPWLGLSGLLFIWMAGAYFSPCFKLKPAGKIFTWCKIRYLTNLSFIKGGLAGCRKFGTINLEPSW